jgi:type I restriction-modification system DNA methylase subunit
MARTRTEALTPTETSKDFGAVFTPMHIAQWLVRWAIRSPGDVVLDPGAGQGAFFIAAFERLKELGASTEAAGQQLWGVELQKEHFERLAENVRARTGTTFPHLHHANLFQEEFPPLDAIIGNPPYVIRARLADINEIAQRVALRTQYAVKLRGQADLYCYFIMYAASFLKEGGRMALIVSDAWLDADYGVELKEFLLQNFRVEALISFDRRVFPAALVKSLVLLAVRTKQGKCTSSIHAGQTA